MKRLGALGGEGEHAGLAEALQALLEAGVTLQGRVFVVIQASAAQALVVELETQRLDQVQVAAAVGAEPDNVAGIGRNFRLKKDYVEHAGLRARRRRIFYAR